MYLHYNNILLSYYITKQKIEKNQNCTINIYIGLNCCGHGIMSLAQGSVHSILLHFPAHGILSLSQRALPGACDIMPYVVKCVNDNMA